TYTYRVRQVDFDGNIALSPYAQIKRLYQNSAEVHPNPINNEMKIELSLEHDAITQIYMFDNTNKIVKVILENIHLQAGESIFKINVEDIPNGHYVLLFTLDGIIITKNLVVIHN
ncbi:MAG: hypothetical protein KBF35_10680, partial [Saprospiraceae bacterium]|nr:hypothetical protein [Saprospiraceae bacterium]